MPPHDENLEMALIGSLLVESERIIDVMSILQPVCFYDNRLSKVYEVMLKMYSNDEPIDLLTVRQKYNEPLLLAQCTSVVASVVNISEYALLIKEMYIKRKVITEASNISAKAYTGDIDECITDLTKLTENVVDGMYQSDGIVTFNDSCDDMITDLHDKIKKNRSGEATGIPSGFDDLDRYTGGFQDTDLIILAARPAMGKTSVVINWGKNSAKKGYKTVIFSLEMSELQLTQKLACGEADISPTKVKRGSVSDAELEQLTAFTNEIKTIPLLIDDDAGATIEKISAKMRQLSAKNGVDLILIDYLQLIGSTAKHGNREQEVSYISRSLKRLAKDCHVPIIALSQLNRGVMNTANKKPQLSDLRESGAIEQDADIVMFVHRDGYYDKDLPQDEGVIIVSKHRGGGCGEIKFKHNEPMTKFYSWLSESDENKREIPIELTLTETTNANEKFEDEAPF